MTLSSFACLRLYLYFLVLRKSLRRRGNPWLPLQTVRTLSAYNLLSTVLYLRNLFLTKDQRIFSYVSSRSLEGFFFFLGFSFRLIIHFKLCIWCNVGSKFFFFFFLFLHMRVHSFQHLLKSLSSLHCSTFSPL